MKNNTRKNYGKENRNFQDEPQKKNFKKSKLSEDFDYDFTREDKIFRNASPYNQHSHFPKENRRGYNSIFDL